MMGWARGWIVKGMILSSYDVTWSWSVVFLEDQILKDPVKASLVDSIMSDLVLLQLIRPSSHLTLWNPSTWESPLEPTSSVRKQARYPVFLTVNTSSLYLASFLWAASTIGVSYSIISSIMRIFLVESSQQTMSGSRSVSAICVGNW